MKRFDSRFKKIKSNKKTVVKGDDAHKEQFLPFTPMFSELFFRKMPKCRRQYVKS